MMRKGLGKGKGSGYYNILKAHDHKVHRDAGFGMKQPQRMPFMPINPALAKYSNVKLQEGTVKESIEHPKFSMAQARQIAKDHLTENPRAYGKWQYGDRDLNQPHTLEEQRIAKFRKVAREKDIDPVLFEEFMMRAFPDAMGGYEKEWADRFKTGNPMKYMDSNTLKIYKSVLKDYQIKYFTKGGKCGGKLGKGSVAFEFQSVSGTDSEWIKSPFSDRKTAEKHPEWFKKVEKNLQDKYGESWAKTGKTEWIVPATKGGKCKGKKPNVYLEDDGTLDTVVSVNGQTFRFDTEYASQFRNKKTGAITKAGWKRLKKEAIDAYEMEQEYPSDGGKKPELEYFIRTKKFRNKKTGEIVTQVPILEINDYEEVKGGKHGEMYCDKKQQKEIYNLAKDEEPSLTFKEWKRRNKYNYEFEGGKNAIKRGVNKLGTYDAKGVKLVGHDIGRGLTWTGRKIRGGKKYNIEIGKDLKLESYVMRVQAKNKQEAVRKIKKKKVLMLVKD